MEFRLINIKWMKKRLISLLGNPYPMTMPRKEIEELGGRMFFPAIGKDACVL